MTSFGLHPMRSTPPEEVEGKWVGASWSDVIESVHVKDDLDSFVSLVKCQCVSAAREREIGALVAQELMKAQDTEATFRALCILRAVVECNLPHAKSEIAAVCGATLENLEAEPCFREVVTDILRCLPLAIRPSKDRVEINITTSHSHLPDLIDMEANQLSIEHPVNAEVPRPVDLLCSKIPLPEMHGHYSMDFLGLRELHETAGQSPSAHVLSSGIFSFTPCTSSLTMRNVSEAPLPEDKSDFDPFIVLSGALSSSVETRRKS